MHGLRPAASLESYIDSPIGRYFAADNAAAFWASEVLNGIVFWGRPDSSDLETMTSALRAGLSPRTRAHASLVDVRRLEHIDLRSFGRSWSGLASHFTSVASILTCRIMIGPRGPAGRVLSELFTFSPADVGVRWFVDPAEALASIQLDDPALLADLDRLPGVSATRTSLLTDVRTFLDQWPTSRADKMSSHFGMSQRTFQRRLREAGTSFQRELNEAHVRLAKRLMRHTDKPLKCIASESGYSSLQHFSSSFRARVGMSPGRWRAHDE
jgi:AraC-like DNA-binding protein